MAYFDFTGNDGIKLTWTASQMSPTAMLNLPSIKLVEYYQQYSAIIGQINNWIKGATNKTNPYEGLYIAEPTNNIYNLPFFSEYHHTIGQNWGEYNGIGGEAFKTALDNIETGVKLLTPAGAIIRPKSYEGPDEASYEIRFSLLNTVGDTSEQVANNISNNRNFIQTFTGANLHDYHAFFIVEPPCLYSAMIPGVRWSPVAVVRNLQISNKGHLLSKEGLSDLNLDGFNKQRYIIPDAWEVSFTLVELVRESKKIYEGAIEENVNVNILPKAPPIGIAAKTINPLVNREYIKNAPVAGIGKILNTISRENTNET